MWNEILKRIDGNNTPQRAIKPWNGAVSSIKLISDGINLVYRFERNSDVYYLRITHAELRSEDELLAAITYQRHLFEHDVPICEPILSLNGLWIEHIQQGAELFLAHVCREVAGKPIHFDHTDLALYKRWGIVLGKLHQAALSYHPGKYTYTSWEKSLEELHGYAQHESQALQDTLNDVTKFFNERKQTSENYGLTHGDHRKGNVLTDGHQIHIIDPAYAVD
jgi:Ser/Thr protein kinase RdoA (MazF antagonist)